MKKNQFSKTDAALVIIFIFLLLLAGVGYTLFGLLPKAVESDFGAAADNLSWLERTSLSIDLLRNRNDLLTPITLNTDALTATEEVNTTNENEQETIIQSLTFVIEDGEFASQIAEKLAQEIGINKDAFISYLRYKGFDKSIQQGKFDIENGLTALEIATYLKEQQKVIVVWPGNRLEEVAETVGEKTTISEEEFLDMARYPSNYGIISRLPIENGLEGFLYPQTYRISHEDFTAFELITAMLLKMESVVTPEMVQGFEDHGLTVKEAFTMASMIERETNEDSEMATMASVYYNRMEVEMKFQSDPTVQYGLRNNIGSGDWWPAITQADYTTVDSPYNTYLYAGFPPTPIGMPSEAALWAVAEPDDTNYYYFRSCSGEDFHRFSNTHEEHLNACP